MDLHPLAFQVMHQLIQPTLGKSTINHQTWQTYVNSSIYNGALTSLYVEDIQLSQSGP